MGRKYKKRPGKRNYQNYSLDTLQNAVEEVKNGKISLRKAAIKYGVPRQTIKNSVNNGILYKTGGVTALSKEIELELVEILKIAADWGYPLEQSDLRQMVKKFLDENNVKVAKFVDNLPGTEWFAGFKERHGSVISMKTSQNVKRGRSQVSSKQVNEYFDRLEMSLKDVSSDNIINYDETNITDDPGSVKVICRRSAKHADRVIDTSKTSTSVMFSGTASGIYFSKFN